MKNQNNNNILLHIPHANHKIPFNIGHLLIDLDELYSFSRSISDLYIDDLFSHNIGEMLIAPYSRVFCDVEKFADDQVEVMSKYGQGVFYTKDCTGKDIRYVTEQYKQKILNEYYYPYHRQLDELTLSLLNKKLIIVDCHSYFEECVLYNKSESYSDIDIGFSNQYYSKELVEGIKTIFERSGYTVSFNSPYEGTIIPNIIYDKNIPDVYALMIEINKRIYMNDRQKYNKCKSTIKEVLNYIRHF